MDDLDRFQSDMRVLLHGLGDKDKLKTIHRKISQYLKKSTAKRVKAQKEVDGSAFAPRKQFEPRNAYQRHQSKQKLLTGLAKATYLKSKYNADRLQVGYKGRAAKLAEWQNEGMVQRMKGGHHIVVPARNYHGISDEDWKAVNEIIYGEL